jgi:vacuolar-type H+-ATPase subunit E/Vma4
VKEYQQMMAKEVRYLKGREPPCKLIVDTDAFLPEYDENEAADSCIGGIMMHSKKGRIVCSNTFDDRLALCYQEAIPDIRRTLFPSFARPGK